MTRSKSILITGCSSGIGLDAAQTLHKLGWQVFATCRDPNDCEALIGQGIQSFELDYARTESIESAVGQVLENTSGKLDAVFNNGAFAIPGFVEDLPRDALRDIFETNVFGQFELINLLMPTFRAQGRGRIINCSSVLGFAALRYRGAYNSTKFAMEGLTDTLRLELHGSGIKVVLIEPGPINTQIRVNSIPHFERWIDIENSAHAAAYKEQLKPRLYQTEKKKDRFELPPSAVTQKLLLALEKDNPKPRYYVTTPTYLAGYLKRILSSRGFDRFCLRL
ncbi:MAG: SDR family NAD(P)-dependent oxidoreductase [Gammaproteobacteria bacterium]|nr:SDR family NAD(P)-dependent oxidoreductase [Gammaproteobacteria bacterium]